MKIILLLVGVFCVFSCVTLAWSSDYDESDSLVPPTSGHLTASRSIPSPVPSDGTVRNLSSEEWIIDAGDRHSVPKGALYGMWAKESAKLDEGWGEGKGWLLASEIVKPGGACHREYDVKWPGFCDKQWKALKAVCAQKRDGRPICDSYEVRSSYALAVGPLQHLPMNIMAPGPDGRMALTDYAVDADGDGVVDPHRLGDAMHMTAKFLRKQKDTGVSWTHAVNAYFGSQKLGYLEGTTRGDIGVVEHWRRWCQQHKCQESPNRLLASLSDF